MRLLSALGVSPGRVWTGLLLAAWSLGFVKVGVAADLVAPIVPTFHRFHGAGEEPVAGGELLLGELNCTSCHAAEKSALSVINPKQAPILDTIGSRVRPEYFAKFLSNPLAAKPGTTMPDVFAGWSEADRAAAVEALGHFLATTGTPSEQRIAPSAIGKGEELFHRIGCVACHNPIKPDAEQLSTSVPLGKAGNKYTLPGLMQFLSNPHAVRPSGRMPNLNLEGEQARDLASFLLRDLKDLQLPSNLKYAYYEGEFGDLPDFSKLTPKLSGETSGFDLAFTPRKDNFAVRFTGMIQIAKEGEYTFHITSDDGSRLTIDDKVVVNNDGIHAPTPKSGKVKLTAGTHAVIVDYFEAAGGEEVSVAIEGNGLGTQPLENFLVVEKKPDPTDKPKFTINASLAEKGKQLFTSVGCASCHQLNYGGQKLASTIKGPSLADLKTSGGCLTATPAKATPLYSLNDAQKKALAAGIAAVQKPLPEATAQDKIARHLKTFNCYACHQRGELGGIEEGRNKYFATTQPEMGDEGRIPPPLTGVGGKLKTDYLKQLLELGLKERPYMHTRMPRFANPDVVSLHQEFGKVDPAPELKKLDIKYTGNELRHNGYVEVGAKGYSCIKCHTWGGTAATGIQSINMQRMNSRLKQEWFEAYLLNPQAFRPGTRMPAAWPEGQVLLPKILDGKADTQIRAIWTYLTDGEKARVPYGLGRDPIELVAEDEAIMYRNFIEGGGPRAIGVGYPEKVNLAFDANQMRLAMIWQGAFMDASKHWIDRGAGFQPPLGDNVVHLVNGPPLAILEDPTSLWPNKPAKEVGFKFKGYHLDKKRQPTFLYSFNDIEIADEPVPTKDGEIVGFRRTLTLTTKKPVEHLYLRAALGEIKSSGDAFSVGAGLQMKISGGGKPIVRGAGDKAELLVPITFTDGQAKIVQEYAW